MLYFEAGERSVHRRCVCQQFKIQEVLGFYYCNNDCCTCVVDFVNDIKKAISAEVKTEVNLKVKSPQAYRDKFNPKI